MGQERGHCVLLALPVGRDQEDIDRQSSSLRNHFITYLQLKSAAGIVNVGGSGGDGVERNFVVHVFPNCDFANRTMGDRAPDLFSRVADVEHMVIIITDTT